MCNIGLFAFLTIYYILGSSTVSVCFTQSLKFNNELISGTYESLDQKGNMYEKDVKLFTDVKNISANSHLSGHLSEVQCYRFVPDFEDKLHKSHTI